MSKQDRVLIDRLRELLQAWEPRVLCPQCGNHYNEKDWACGPTHAVVRNLVYPALPQNQEDGE